MLKDVADSQPQSGVGIQHIQLPSTAWAFMCALEEKRAPEFSLQDAFSAGDSCWTCHVLPRAYIQLKGFAASCHVQPLLTPHYQCRGGRSVLERWQEWQAELKLRAARHCYWGWQLKEECWSGISACSSIAVGFAASSCRQSVKFAKGAYGLFWQLQTHSA